MSQFLRLLSEKNKGQALSVACAQLRHGQNDSHYFKVAPRSFNSIPGKPFAYWASNCEFGAFEKHSPLASGGVTAKQGLATANDFRFLRLWWETDVSAGRWRSFAKGGSFSPFYADIHLVINWRDDGAEIRNQFDPDSGRLMSRPQNIEYFGRPGLTWPLRSQIGLGMRVMPSGCAFGHKGPAVFVRSDDAQELLALLSIVVSSSYKQLIALHMAFGSYEVGVIQRTPVPALTDEDKSRLADLASQAWSLKRKIEFGEETSHVFLLPNALHFCLPSCSGDDVEPLLDELQQEIDRSVSEVYGLDSTKNQSDVQHLESSAPSVDSLPDTEVVDESDSVNLLSWCVGVAMGRFDFRLATGGRELQPAPEPFDPLPAKSPGMLPDGDKPFHNHAGLLVDAAGHPHDLAQLMEAVLECVEVQVPDNLRRWLQTEFFKEHLNQYSKSRRKAPIYWPLSTASGGYTLWLYYPDLDDQTLYTAINDFLEPKLKLVGDELNSLRAKTSRTTSEVRELEKQQDLEQEIIELRDTILGIAPTYKPNHDDGVQITAAPLWSLFRHKPWQKILKDTWEKLEAGEYDWAHLAYSYWPERVREKCKTDKSLAIAHGLGDDSLLEGS